MGCRNLVRLKHKSCC